MEQSQPIEGHEYVFGIDWGYREDATVLIVYDTTEKEVVALYSQKHSRFSDACEAIETAYAQWKPSACIADEHSIGAVFVAALTDRGLPMRPVRDLYLKRDLRNMFSVQAA